MQYLLTEGLHPTLRPDLAALFASQSDEFSSNTADHASAGKRRVSIQPPYMHLFQTISASSLLSALDEFRPLVTTHISIEFHAWEPPRCMANFNCFANRCSVYMYVRPCSCWCGVGDLSMARLPSLPQQLVGTALRSRI